MFSLQLFCPAAEAEFVAAQLWDWDCVALAEHEWSDEVRLVAGFHSDRQREELLAHFAAYEPVWEQDETDWERETRAAWPAREIGRRFFLAPPWQNDETPPGRIRLVHNPGQASGTGEHPCTQLMLEALEQLDGGLGCVLDVGAGSGILAIAAKLLGATEAFALDTDEESLATARVNFHLNSLPPLLLAGSAACIQDAVADLTLANISGTVLLSILDELMRVTKRGGWLVISGFGEGEARTFFRLFPDAQLSSRHEWRCLAIRLS